MIGGSDFIRNLFALLNMLRLVVDLMLSTQSLDIPKSNLCSGGQKFIDS